MPLWLRVWKEDDLAPLVETLRKLMLDRTIENVPQIWNTISFASVMSSRSLWYDGDEPVPDEIIDRKKRGFAVPVHEWFSATLGEEAEKEVRAFCEETDILDWKEISR